MDKGFFQMFLCILLSLIYWSLFKSRLLDAFCVQDNINNL